MGLPTSSTYTIWTTLPQAGVSGQKSRSWSETGTVVRQRQQEVVAVKDSDTEPKKA
jgi:hypothetical protein